MPRSRTDVRLELISFVRAMRRHASRMRRLVSQGRKDERLRVLADYLDARAAALEATPSRSGPISNRPGTRPRDQRLLLAVLAMLS
jgi:hypothetical protein